MKYFFLVTFSLYGCSSATSTENHNQIESKKKSKIVSTDCDSILVCHLPISLRNTLENKLILQILDSSKIECLRNNHLTSLFSPNTVIDDVAFLTGHPNDSNSFWTYPVIYEKIESKKDNGIKNLLFAYHSSYDADGTGKTTTIELQTFNNKEKIDELILLDAVYGEDANWIRECDISENYLITIKDTYSSYDEENAKKLLFKKVITFKFKLNEDGYIVKFFDKKDGMIDNKYEDPFSNDNIFFFEKGEIKEHLKEGLWNEIQGNNHKSIYDFVKPFDKLNAMGYYREGKKDGQWVYFRKKEAGTNSTYPVLAETYRKGKLEESIYDFDKINKNYSGLLFLADSLNEH